MIEPEVQNLNQNVLHETKVIVNERIKNFQMNVLDISIDLIEQKINLLEKD